MSTQYSDHQGRLSAGIVSIAFKATTAIAASRRSVHRLHRRGLEGPCPSEFIARPLTPCYFTTRSTSQSRILSKDINWLMDLV